MNNKSHTLNLENFRDMLQICPRLPGQKFEDPPFEEEILSFIRDLGHTREIKILTDVNIYGAILPDELNNQELLDSKAYKEYYAIAFGVEPPKVKTKYKKKVDEPVTPSRSKTAPASKGSRLKSPAMVAKNDKKKQRAMMPKTKGLAVLSKVALTKAEQIKLATKRSKKDFHISYASGSGDGVDIQLKVPDEQQQKVTGIIEGVGVRLEVPDVPKYTSESEEESWTFSQDNEDDAEESDMNDDSEETESDNDGDNLTHPNLSTYKADDQEEEEEKENDEEVSFDQREQDEEDDLYRDVNINLERSDAKMTDAQANKDTKDTHVTLTVVPPVVQQQSSYVSSDLVSKFINPSSDTCIDSILNPNIQSHTLVNVPVSVTAETPFSDTTLPPPPIPNIQTLQQTPSSTTTTTIPTIAMPDIPDFVYSDLINGYPLWKLKCLSSSKQINLLKLVPPYDQDKDEDPSAGSNRGSKRRRSGKEAESSKELTHKESKSTGSSKGATRSQPKSLSKSAHAEEHGQKVDDLEDQSH
ncbi:hypothetical protein Tco_0360049 [Tanacetum coccineum]